MKLRERVVADLDKLDALYKRVLDFNTAGMADQMVQVLGMKHALHLLLFEMDRLGGNE